MPPSASAAHARRANRSRIPAQHHRTVIEQRTRRRQRQTHVDTGAVRLCLGELGQASGLRPQRLRAPPRQHPRHHRQPLPRRPDLRPSGSAGAASGASSRMTCALVPLIPNDDTPPGADAPPFGHSTASVSSSHRTRRPVHLRRRLIHVQRPRQHAVPHRHHHLDHTSHTRGGLRVADVRLHRPQPQRLVLGARPGRTSPAAPAPRSGHPAAYPYHAPPPRPPRRPTSRADASA